LLKRIDKILFSEFAVKKYREKLKRNEMEKFISSLKYSYSSYYHKNYHSLFSKLCDKYGSDKGEIDTSGNPYPWPSHTYSDYYSRLFDHCRFNITKVFECGLGTNNPNLISSMGSSGKPGASLRVWRDYFPNASVIGADIDKSILFNEERIETFFVDQTNSKLINEMWKNININDFDLIIDDGLHTFEAGICLFENSIKRLSDNGIYIIEDVHVNTLVKFEKYFDNNKYQVDFINLFRPDIDLGDNCLVVIRKVN